MNKTIFILCALAQFVAATQIAAAGIWVAPVYVGSGAEDSVVVSFCTFDTTFYPRITNADSIIALRYGPDNALLDSLTQSSPQLHNIRNGWYELHYRGADESDAEGLYRVYVRAKIGGDWRGAASVSYQVIGNNLGGYLAKLSADSDSIKDTLSSLSQLATGGGAYLCTLSALRSGSGTPIAGVALRILNQSETAALAFGRTDSEGQLRISLDAGEYHVVPHLTGYRAITLPAIITVTSLGANDTIWLEQFDPGAPLSPELCRVYGYVQTLSGESLAGAVVTASVWQTPLLYQGAVISPYAVSTTSDSIGYWQLDLLPNATLNPADTKYDVTIYYPSGTIIRRQFVVPDSTQYWFGW